MQDSFAIPSWEGTSLDSPITKVAIPLIAIRDGITYPSGTACVIAPWLAITARHVVEDHFKYFADRFPNQSDTATHHTLTYLNPGGGHGAIPLFVQRTWYLPPYDIAVLWLWPASEMDPKHVWDCARLSLLPPEIGSRVFAFGYPNSRSDKVVEGKIELRMDATTSTGTIKEVHHERRDAVMYPFPCFHTNARFDGGMNGGPVFNQEGNICGLVCGSLPAESPEIDHTSYVSSLWPLLAIQIDAPWDRYAAGTKYPLYEYAQERIVDVIGLEHFSVDKEPEGSKLSIYYDVSSNKS